MVTRISNITKIIDFYQTISYILGNKKYFIFLESDSDLTKKKSILYSCYHRNILHIIINQNHSSPNLAHQSTLIIIKSYQLLVTRISNITKIIDFYQTITYILGNKKYFICRAYSVYLQSGQSGRCVVLEFLGFHISIIYSFPHTNSHHNISSFENNHVTKQKFLFAFQCQTLEVGMACASETDTFVETNPPLCPRNI